MSFCTISMYYHAHAHTLHRLFHMIKKLVVYLTNNTTEDVQKLYVDVSRLTSAQTKLCLCRPGATMKL